MVSVKQNPIGMDGKGSKPTTVKEAQANAKLLYNQVMSALDATNALLDRTPLNDKMTLMKLERAKRELLDRYDKAIRKLVGSYENPNGGLSQHIDAAFDAAASGDRGGLTTTKAAIRKALNSAKQPEGQKAQEYIFGVLDIIVKNRSKWSGAQTQKAVKEYSAAVYGKVLPKLKIEQNPKIPKARTITAAQVNRLTADAIKALKKYKPNAKISAETQKSIGREIKYLWERELGVYRQSWEGAREAQTKELAQMTWNLLTQAEKDFIYLDAAAKSRKNETTTDFHAFKENRSYDKVLPKLSIKENPRKTRRHFVDPFEGMSEAAIRAYNDVAKGMSETAFYKKHKVGDYGQYKETSEKYAGRLFRLKPLKNETASDFTAFKQNKSKEHFKMFQGKQPSGSVRVLQPDSAPKETSRLGDLVLMKVIKSNGSKQNINFDGEAFLVMDLRRNLWTVGKDARISNITLPRKGELKYLGKLKQIDYVTAKKHIGGNKLTRFWHELGEVDKNYPSLYVDADGFPIIHGGGYDVWNIGIVN